MTLCSNPKIGELVAQYELGMLSEDSQRRFAEHVMECDHCLSELEQMAPFIGTIIESRSELVARLNNPAASPDSPDSNISSIALNSERSQRTESGSIDWIMRWLITWRKPQFWLPAMAIATALLVISWTTLYQPKNPYLSSLSFDRLPYNSSLMRSATPESIWLEHGIEAYERGDLSAAIINLKKAVQQYPNDGHSQMILGVSYYLNRQAELAISSLSAADSLSTGFPQLHIRWYLAQSYLIVNEPQMAEPLLQWIVDQNLGYVDSARSLIQLIHVQTQ